MSKAIAGAAMLAGAVGMGIATMVDPALLAMPLWDKLWAGLAIEGIAMEAGALADALSANRGMGITTRQPAAPCQIIYGEYRVGGLMAYATTTGSHKDQYNKIIAVACHPIDAFVNLYLDGRQVFWEGDGGSGTQGQDDILFGGDADGNDHYDSGNNRYNFGGLVFCSFYRGTDQPGFYDPFINANDPNWGPSANGTPYGGDISYAYVKVEADAAMFPQDPELRWTIRGKNNIWDPRTNTYGYTCNWALCVADVLMNSQWGLGVPQAMINTEQLIIAANLCDELVELANGTQERRYTYNNAFDTSSSPGDILQSMMGAAGGNVTYSGGQYYIWPAAAYVPTFDWSQDDLIGGIQGSAYRSNADLYNRVGGTFTCPNYPFSPAGDLYDAAGHDPDGYSQNNFNYAWQKTSYPEYAQDTLHGYPSDQWLTQDGGIIKRMTMNFQGVISLATAQRLAKIALLRNRLEKGEYSFKMKLQGFQMAVMDVFTLTFPQLGWSAKQLQVTDITLAINYEDDRPSGLCVEVKCKDFDPSVYDWEVQEELTILDQSQYPSQGTYTVEPPTEVTVSSGPAYDITNTDGVVIPRVFVSWVEPPDIKVTQIEVQWSPTGQNSWTSVGTVPIINLDMYFIGPTAGQTIDVQVRSLTATGAGSTWVQEIGLLVSTTAVSSITSIGISPGIPYNVSNNATIDTIAGQTNSSAVLRVYGPGGVGTSWSLVYGSGTVSVPAMTTPVNYSSSGFVVLIIPAGKGLADAAQGDILPETNFNQTISDNAVLIGTYTAVSTSGTGGVTGGGGSTGGGAACTVEGTLLDTPEGPVSNIILKNRFDMGLPVYLTGENGQPEKIVSAKWVQVAWHQNLKVGAVDILCSDTHTVSVDGKHMHCSTVPTGTLVDTRTGKVVMDRTQVMNNARVLAITLSGPSHVYSVGGVLTHNIFKSVNPAPDA